MRVLIAGSMDPGAVSQLREAHDVASALGPSEDALKSCIADREVLIFRSGVRISASVMAAAPGLKLVIRAGSGLDNIDIDYLRARAIPMVRIPGPAAQAVAELTFALMLSLARRLLEADPLLRRGRWAKHELNGQLLSGKVLGIIGAGNIGSRVGEMGAVWGMKVLGCVEHPSSGRERELWEKGITLMDCRAVMAAADFVTVHVPLKDSTRNLIGVRELALMRRGSFLLNLARGGVVDERALFQALTDDGGRLAGAALDVHTQEGEGKISPLAGLSNVVLTPHVGAMTTDTQREIGERVVELVDGFAETGVISGVGEDCATFVYREEVRDG